MTSVEALHRCSYCGEQLDPLSPWVHQRVIGWQRMAGVRASGKHGGSDISLRETLDEWACPGCIGRLKAGVHIAQESLL